MSRSIQERLLSLKEFEESHTVSIYMDFDNEVRTREIVSDSLQRGKRVVIPYMKGKNNTLLLSEVRDMEKELERNTFGILEPKREYFRYIPDSEVEMLVVPGVAFDEKGRRLGFGGGYYDRLLINVNKSTLTIGLAYEFQIVREIPWWFYDIFIDRIITEKRMIQCQNQETREGLPLS